jgi:ABC-type transporter Mla subunit MlaD
VDLAWGVMVTPWGIAGWLWRWNAQLASELGRLPWTIGVLRESLTSLSTVILQLETLGRLPDEIDALTGTLNQTIQALDGTLGAVDRAMGSMVPQVARLDEAMGGLGVDLAAFRDALERTLPELASVVGGMDDRLQRVEDVVSQLGEALLTVMGAIPGVRRALRDPRGTHALVEGRPVRHTDRWPTRTQPDR